MCGDRERTTRGEKGMMTKEKREEKKREPTQTERQREAKKGTERERGAQASKKAKRRGAGRGAEQERRALRSNAETVEPRNDRLMATFHASGHMMQ